MSYDHITKLLLLTSLSVIGAPLTLDRQLVTAHKEQLVVGSSSRSIFYKKKRRWITGCPLNILSAAIKTISEG
uniref:Putative secreted protein n=1 Tax=Anopheles marajoara TaxID=58244 RepID=A0A2M4CDP3_9DIPT